MQGRRAKDDRGRSLLVSWTGALRLREYGRRAKRAAYQKCLLAKACPDPVFTYFSNCAALASSSKRMVTTTFHGPYLEVCGDLPELCSARRLRKLDVIPT